MRANRSRWTFYATCIATSVAFAGPPPQSCTTIADDIHRLACYDSAFKYSPPAPAAGSSGTAAPIASPPVATAAAAHAAANSAVASPAVLERTDDFGLSQQAQRDRAGVVAVESISAGVTRVDRNAADRLVVTLDNGQVWQQSETSSQVRVRPGDTVTIKRAALGSFMLVTAKNGSTRAKRIK
jgi:hypothetical protein